MLIFKIKRMELILFEILFHAENKLYILTKTFKIEWLKKYFIFMRDDLNCWVLGSRYTSQISQGQIIIHSWLSSLITYVTLICMLLDLCNIFNIFFKHKKKHSVR